MAWARRFSGHWAGNEAGNSAIAGLAIVAMAVIIDRITQAAARERERILLGDWRIAAFPEPGDSP